MGNTCIFKIKTQKVIGIVNFQRVKGGCSSTTRTICAEPDACASEQDAEVVLAISIVFSVRGEVSAKGGNGHISPFCDRDENEIRPRKVSGH